jgi:hypothetical protein
MATVKLRVRDAFSLFSQMLSQGVKPDSISHRMTWQVIFRHWPLLLAFFEGRLSQSDTQVENLQYKYNCNRAFRR